MLVLLKSLRELVEEYGIEEGDSYLIIGDNIIPKSNSIIKFFGKVVEADYEKETNTFIINGYYFDPSLIKGIVIREEYTIKRFSDSLNM